MHDIHHEMHDNFEMLLRVNIILKGQLTTSF